jgi:plasmid stability protein
MKSITIHKLDNDLDALIRDRARREGISLDKTVKKLLEESLGIKPKDEDNRKEEEFLDIFGAWSEEEACEFDRTTRDFEKIDLKDWC